MYPKLFSLFVFIFTLHATCSAQFYPTQYRPPNQNWQQLSTGHFNFIFAQGNKVEAFKLGNLLESHYPNVQNIVGGKLNDFPVILNNYNDRSNGFVTSFNFRSEIELPPIKGKSLNPQTGNWLTNVGPHELVHALQFNNLGTYNLPRLISLFSPDLARMFHGAIPMGMHEGIAVYYETENITANGGRGNYPFFTGQFDATFNSDSRWSMGQLMQVSHGTHPFGRHYIGGYVFTDWLHNRFGENITQNALDFYIDFPFLGYGFALRHATGLWPAQLYNRFEEHQEKRLQNTTPSTSVLEINVPFKGREIRRPKWLSHSKLVFYGSFYNARPGFYIYNLKTKEIERLFVTNTVRDFQYDLSDDQSQLIYSYYKADLIYDNTSKTELVQFDLESRKRNRLTNHSRLYAPVFSGDTLFALKSHPARSRLIILPRSDVRDEREVFSASNHEIKAVAVSPRSKQLAIVSNKSGQQALWITDRKDLGEQLNDAPDLAFKGGAVFDPEWHPLKNRVLFSSDFSGAMQLYEWNIKNDTVYQLTDHPHGAFEGSYDDDGERIAYVYQHNNERLPTVLQRKNFLGRPVPINHRHLSFAIPREYADSVTNSPDDWQTKNYSPGLHWLKPRTVLPVAYEVSNRNTYEAGLSFHSVNTLSTQAYSADITYFKERGWYDIRYHNKTFFPGFRLRAFNEPSYRFVSDVGDLARQERSLELSIPFQINFERNIYNTSLLFSPEIRQTQFRFFDRDFNTPISDFANITAGNIFTRFNYRLQQNIRDLQPNSGFIIFSEAEHYLSGDEVSFSTSQNDFSFLLSEETALQGGIFGYVAPLKRWNQSLRVGVRGITQSGPIFDNQSLVSDGFSESVFAGSHNLLSMSTRYTLPITYVDDGSLLFPFYLSNIYLVTFTNTVIDPAFSDWYRDSRTVFGIGLRVNFRISNLGFNIGFGYGYEPTRRQSQFFIGDF